ncbi:zinc knuckle CX2CX4HX4C containing protein [Tanacetum coccineum]|uniref:Zinc knuckle CX2CX4HX4C containing protein n=1 Tax=Tanacetum coccineum TaxID=301880 RepID=A0ABQ5J3R0_9ASTR
MWRTCDLAEIITNECGLYFLKFRWEAGLCMEKPEPTRVPLWVKIMNVPLEAWNTYGIMRLASSLGNPIIMDIITTSMSEKAYGRASFARVLVKVDATKELADSIKRTEEERNERDSSKHHDLSNGVDESLKANGGWQDIRRPIRNVASTSNNAGKQNVVRTDGGYRGGYNG